RSINTSMPHFVVENVNKLMAKSNSKVVTLFGLTYKGNVDDIRESPAMEIMELLQEEGNYEIRAFDPHVEKDFVIKDLKAAVKDSGLVVILSDHNEFKNMDWKEFNGMESKRIFDTKNVVKNANDEVTYINYGNLYEGIK